MDFFSELFGRLQLREASDSHAEDHPDGTEGYGRKACIAAMPMFMHIYTRKILIDWFIEQGC